MNFLLELFAHFSIVFVIFLLFFLKVLSMHLYLFFFNKCYNNFIQLVFVFYFVPVS